MAFNVLFIAALELSSLVRHIRSQSIQANFYGFIHLLFALSWGSGLAKYQMLRLIDIGFPLWVLLCGESKLYKMFERWFRQTYFSRFKRCVFFVFTVEVNAVQLLRMLCYCIWMRENEPFQPPFFFNVGYVIFYYVIEASHG